MNSRYYGAQLFFLQRRLLLRRTPVIRVILPQVEIEAIRNFAYLLES